MKNKLIFLFALVLCIGIVISLFGFSNNNFLFSGIGGFLFGFSITGIHFLRKA